MNCWKAINIQKQYGTKRVFILSSLTMLLTFIFLFVPATYVFVPRAFNDNYIVHFLIVIWLMFFLHKFFHLLPLLHLGKKVKKTFMMKYGIFPHLNIRVHEPIPKWLFLLSLLTPFIMINTLLFICCNFFSYYVHYFVILLAYHIGISVSDFICIKNVLSAPNQAYIEETEDGFDILLKQTQ
nr:DUF3267 domain-containing protein [uncultured Bacillus sp.]